MAKLSSGTNTKNSSDYDNSVMHSDQCDVNINTDPWNPQCPICMSVSEPLSFSLKNNINSTQYMQALQYINAVHQLFNNAMSNDKMKISLPEVPNFLSIFSTINSEIKDKPVCTSRDSDIKKKQALKKALFSNKNLTGRREFQERKRVKKTTSDNINCVERLRKWCGFNDSVANVVPCYPVLLSQHLTKNSLDSASNEKLKTCEKLKKSSIRKPNLSCAPKDKYSSRSEADKSFLHYSSDNISNFKKSLSTSRNSDKKRNKCKLKPSPTPRPATRSEDRRNVQMQTSQCWSTQKIRKAYSGVVHNNSVNHLKSVRTLGKINKRNQGISTEYLENFVPMSNNQKQKNLMEVIEIGINNSKMPSVLEFNSHETILK